VDVTNQRRHARFCHQAKVRLLVPPSTQTLLLNMKNFSEGGLYLSCTDGVLPPLGALVEVQTTEFPDAPILKARVVRVEEGAGIGLEFEI
jgi:hypothetical protein